MCDQCTRVLACAQRGRVRRIPKIDGVYKTRQGVINQIALFLKNYRNLQGKSIYL